MMDDLPYGYRLEQQGTCWEVVCDMTNEVIYRLDGEAKCSPDNWVKPLLNISVWRSQDVRYSKVISGFTEHLMQHYLLPNYVVAIACDSPDLQRDFWVRQCGYAMAFGATIWRHDLDSREVFPVAHHAAIRDNSARLWGRSAQVWISNCC